MDRLLPQSGQRSMLSGLASVAGSAQQYLAGWPSRYGGEDEGGENLTFQDMDGNPGEYFEGGQDGSQNRKIDMDFFNQFEDDFDEADMKTT
ncbi:hypothetical protein WJX74_003814 [Apatococcus lobatus]|uniref:Uncharacterized protein n=1 Tax=Apatococcus lobatus TaxID=904363 RepID=A0AAW1RDH0_9CHLO